MEKQVVNPNKKVEGSSTWITKRRKKWKKKARARIKKRGMATATKPSKPQSLIRAGLV